MPLKSALPAYGRKLLVEAARITGQAPLLLEILTPPLSIEELIDVTEVHIKARDFERARAVFGKYADQVSLSEAHKQELLHRISAGEALRR